MIFSALNFIKKALPSLILATSLLFSTISEAKICKGKSYVPILMSDSWHEKEEQRLQTEKDLLAKYADYITKEFKPLEAQIYKCLDKKNCDPVKNCQMEAKKNAENFQEVNYLMKTDSGINVIKSYCSVIGKCAGYNDFTHSSSSMASEDRLVDIKHNNAVFYHYFYANNTKDYEPPFNITNLHTANEIYLNDEPHFSPDDRVIIEVKSIPKQEKETNFPTGFDINIYEMNEFGEYKNVEPASFNLSSSDNIISNFLSRNPECGKTPHFHSWKSNREIWLSMEKPSQANDEEKVILAYDQRTKKWGCNKNYFPEPECQSYLPESAEFSSNLAPEQVNRCE